MSLNSDEKIKNKLRENEHLRKLDDYQNSQMSSLKAISNRPIPLLLGLLTLWIVGCTWLYRINCCMNPATLSPLLIQDGLTNVSAADESIRFEKASSMPTIVPKVKQQLEKAVEYLNTHPDKVLIVTGKQRENDKDTLATLATQRAENMKAELIKWGATADYIIPKGEASRLLIPIKDTVYGSMKFAIKTIPGRFMMFSADGLNVNVSDNLAFNKNSAEIIKPISDSIRIAGASMAAYLKANPNQQLRIKGWSGNSENGRMLDRIGNLRAENLRKWWISMGVPANQIIVEQNDDQEDLIFIGEKLYGGATYSLGGVPTEMNKTTAKTNTGEAKNANNSANKLANAPTSVTIYFDYNSDIANISESDRKALATYIQYLNENKDKKVQLSGYTDDKGSIQYNLALSGRRAANIQKYLNKKGIGNNQTTIKKMGILKSTDTGEAARAKSRKVELSILR